MYSNQGQVVLYGEVIAFTELHLFLGIFTIIVEESVQI